MHIYDSWTKLPQQEPVALCIGKFDGVHLGHQALLKTTVNFAKKFDIAAAALVFYPHPLEYFTNKKVITLTSLEQRSQLLKFYGINKIYCIKFNAHLAHLSAHDFLQKVLLDKMQAQAVIIGDDFRFGAKKVGDIALLKSWGRDNNIIIKAVSQCLYNNKRISTSWCRQLLLEKDSLALEQLLGRQNLII